MHRNLYFCDFSREGGTSPHARIPEFLPGGGVQARLSENSSEVFFSFFLILNFKILQFTEGVQWLIQGRLYFSKVSEGVQHFPGGGGGGGVQRGPNANFYRNPYNLSFSRGESGPLSPS